jgi:hypothetical protein
VSGTGGTRHEPTAGVNDGRHQWATTLMGGDADGRRR